jgi:hypothetical protein
MMETSEVMYKNVHMLDICNLTVELLHKNSLANIPIHKKFQEVFLFRNWKLGYIFFFWVVRMAQILRKKHLTLSSLSNFNANNVLQFLVPKQFSHSLVLYSIMLADSSTLLLLEFILFDKDTFWKCTEIGELVSMKRRILGPLSICIIPLYIYTEG